MAQSYPSVQSFYKREIQTENEAAPVEPKQRGDGFTEQELTEALDPMSRKWNPERDYDETTINKLIPGPRAVTFVGRIVNFSTVIGSSQKETKASGWHYILVKDDTAAISIKLYFARKSYPLKLGQLLSFWTSFISDKSKNDAHNIAGIDVYANMFPGRVTSDHVMIHSSDGTASICRAPLEHQRAQSLPGLMTLTSYVGGGHDGVRGAKILVCVKSMGPRRKIARKTGGESELLDVALFDHTAEVRMAMWNEMIESAREWAPGKTVLLISNPGFRVEGSGRGSLGVTRGTMVDVEPAFADAVWLRKYAVGLTRREGLCVGFPKGLWDEEAAEHGTNRMLFTLAELDTWVRTDGNLIFTGFVNVTIMELSLVALHRRNMLMCAECCGIPTFSNTPTLVCLHCSASLTWSLNPRIVGTLLDETGCIAPGKLLWSERAWSQLFGRSIPDITAMTGQEARWLEMRMLFMRIHLVVGWAGQGEEGSGRLGVLGIMS
ncbi:hypothetical protein BJ875DRAFT_17906 [Amylocarpus encephaloides]|uniref:Nucleic acid-binding protein n=1 Tax=Amylocarpus encephaloides TaxID=45428 RepID=A0A9P8C5K7_9HELO|nr:hypothetical protein BJ875DRAFT_17906 [Amylocarpus encephaloides]